MNKNINELQLLRGFGILTVMAHHMNGSLFTWGGPWLAKMKIYFAGTAALDMFFVLSGFLIFRLLHNDLGKAEDRFQSMQISCIFWLRRAWRLLPAAWLWLVIAMLLTLFANQSGTFGPVKDAWGGVLSAFLLVANFKFGDCFLRYSCGPTFPYWSLSLEEQFYVFLPLLMIFSGKWMLRIILAIAFTQYFIPALTLPGYARLQGFLLGVLLGIWSQSPTYRIFEPVFLKNRRWVRRVVLCLLLGWMCSMNKNLIPPFLLAQLAALSGGFLVYFGSFDENYLWADGWLKKFGIWLGSRAYAMYLCHIPLFYLTREIAFRILGPEVPLGPEHFWYLLLGSMTLIVVCAELTYSLLEKPLRRRGMVIAGEMMVRQEAERKARNAGEARLID
jgi:peptidoglycan/LPS O-acetylase OafA/YrhL